MNAKPVIAALSDFPVITTLPIQWGDQDAFGHVNSTVPIRWFESSRVEYLLEIGMNVEAPESGIGPILASISSHYRLQLTYPDTVHIGARVAKVGRSSIDIQHAVFSEAQQAVAVEGDSVVVAYDYASQRPARVPDAIRAAIDRLQGGLGPS